MGQIYKSEMDLYNYMDLISHRYINKGQIAYKCEHVVMMGVA